MKTKQTYAERILNFLNNNLNKHTSENIERYYYLKANIKIYTESILNSINKTNSLLKIRNIEEILYSLYDSIEYLNKKQETKEEYKNIELCLNIILEKILIQKETIQYKQKMKKIENAITKRKTVLFFAEFIKQCNDVYEIFEMSIINNLYNKHIQSINAKMKKY